MKLLMDVLYLRERVCNKKKYSWNNSWMNKELTFSFLPHFIFLFLFLTRLPVVNSNEIHRFLTKAIFHFTVLRCSGKNLGKGSLGEKKEIFSFRFGTNASNKQHLAKGQLISECRLGAFILWFDNFLDSGAEICQIFCRFFGKFKEIKKIF